MAVAPPKTLPASRRDRAAGSIDLLPVVLHRAVHRRCDARGHLDPVAPAQRGLAAAEIGRGEVSGVACPTGRCASPTTQAATSFTPPSRPAPRATGRRSIPTSRPLSPGSTAHRHRSASATTTSATRHRHRPTEPGGLDRDPPGPGQHHHLARLPGGGPLHRRRRQRQRVHRYRPARARAGGRIAGAALAALAGALRDSCTHRRTARILAARGCATPFISPGPGTITLTWRTPPGPDRGGRAHATNRGRLTVDVRLNAAGMRLLRRSHGGVRFAPRPASRRRRPCLHQERSPSRSPAERRALSVPPNACAAGHRRRRRRSPAAGSGRAA